MLQIPHCFLENLKTILAVLDSRKCVRSRNIPFQSPKQNFNFWKIPSHIKTSMTIPPRIPKNLLEYRRVAWKCHPVLKNLWRIPISNFQLNKPKIKIKFFLKTETLTNFTILLNLVTDITINAVFWPKWTASVSSTSSSTCPKTSSRSSARVREGSLPPNSPSIKPKRKKRQKKSEKPEKTSKKEKEKRNKKKKTKKKRKLASSTSLFPPLLLPLLYRPSSFPRSTSFNHFCNPPSLPSALDLFHPFHLSPSPFNLICDERSCWCKSINCKQKKINDNKNYKRIVKHPNPPPQEKKI